MRPSNLDPAPALSTAMAAYLAPYAWSLLLAACVVVWVPPPSHRPASRWPSWPTHGRCSSGCRTGASGQPGPIRTASKRSACMPTPSCSAWPGLPGMLTPDHPSPGSSRGRANCFRFRKRRLRVPSEIADPKPARGESRVGYVLCKKTALLQIADGTPDLERAHSGSAFRDAHAARR